MDQAEQAAKVLEQLVNDYARLDLAVEQIDEIEHKSDHIVHDIVKKLDATFVTLVLFDREDIYQMAETVDTVVDLIKATVDRLKIFGLTEADAHTREMGRLIGQSVSILHDTVCALDGIRLDQTDFCAGINALENEGDAALKRSLADLFQRESDARQIIKWKEIYEFLEKTLDSCEDAANLLENVIVKNA